MLESPHPLTIEERAALRRLALQDTIALFILLAIVIALSGLTWLLFRSFQNHELELAQRWRHRGEVALQKDNPKAAINALHAALAYQPNRATEVELAEALAQAGRIHEATAYFRTLRDSEPGSGIINLQLARLAARQGKPAQAISYYQTALDGTWEGNGYQRRRHVRLELSGYLISIRQFSQARTQLLIATSNAPDQPSIQLKIAGMLEQCDSPADALQIYRHLAGEHPPAWQALAGAGHTAYQLGQFMLARYYLNRALSAHAFSQQPLTTQAAISNMQSTSTQILSLYPSANLSIRERAARILRNVATARARFNGCEAPLIAAANARAPIPNAQSTPALLPPAIQVNPLRQASLANAHNLATRWAKVPRYPSLFHLEQNPQMEQTWMQLVYDTEKDSSVQCGPPQGDDALLYRIAQAPDAVEQQ